MRGPCGSHFQMLGAPLESLEQPNTTAATMVGALRFLLRDSRDSKIAAKNDVTQLERAVSGLNGELKSIQGSDLATVAHSSPILSSTIVSRPFHH